MPEPASAPTPAMALLVKTALSASYCNRVAETVGGPVEVIDLNPILSGGAIAGIRRLRKLRPVRLAVPAEDPATLYLVPILKILAALTGARALETIDPDLERRSFSRWSVLPEGVAFVAASVLNAACAALAAVQTAWLYRRKRIGAARPRSRSVLYFNGNLWFGVKAGGSVGHVAGVVNSLLRRGFEVDFAACAPGAMLDERHQYVPLKPQRVFGYPVELNNFRFHYRSGRAVARHLARKPRGFVYQRLSLGNFTGVGWSRRQGIPLVTEYNGSEAWVAQHWGRPLMFPRLAVAAEDVMLAHSHVIVTVSNVLRDELISRGVEPRRIVTYPNCIDPELFDPARFGAQEIMDIKARHGLPSDAVVATFIGTFGQWHGVNVLATAIRTWAENDPAGLAATRLHFLLVGDGMRMAEVRAILDHPEASKHVTLTGLVPQSQAPGYLAASDILLSPHIENPDGSRFFGSPTKLFEYMAIARPIIASDLDQIGEVLANSIRVDALPSGEPDRDELRLALLCPPGDPQAIIRALQYLAAAPAWRRVLGANARREALEKYTWDRHVGAILEGLAQAADWQDDEAAEQDTGAHRA